MTRILDLEQLRLSKKLEEDNRRLELAILRQMLVDLSVRLIHLPRYDRAEDIEKFISKVVIGLNGYVDECDDLKVSK